MRLKDAVRVAYECGFQWALDRATNDPAIPPEADNVLLTLTEAQGQSALFLTPEEWWGAWSRGWVAGLNAEEGVGHADLA